LGIDPCTHCEENNFQVIKKLWIFVIMRIVFLAMCAGVDSQYNPDEALVYANLATAAYCGYPKTTTSSLEAWQCGPACDAVSGMTEVRQILQVDNNDAFAFVGKMNGECVLSFRGTSDLAGWMSDLKSTGLVDLTAQSESNIPCSYDGTNCKVGDGFMTNYNSIAPAVRGNLSEIGCGASSAGITITGHSLGAAEAVIAMYDLKSKGWTVRQTYTFGQPRVGDKAFQKAFEKDIGTSAVYRLTHYHDPVPHMPLENLFDAGNKGFVHISQEVYYAEKVTGGYKVCDGSGEDKDCSDSYTDLVEMIAACIGGSDCDHLTYLMPTKSTMLDGSSCVNGTAHIQV